MVFVDQEIINRTDWRQELARQYETEARRLRSAYETTVDSLRVQIAALESRLNSFDGDVFDANDLAQLDEYRRLLSRIRAEMADFSRILDDTMRRLSNGAVMAGSDSAYNMALATVGDQLRPLIAGAWLRPDMDSLVNLINYMDSSAMRENLRLFGDNAASKIADTVLAFTAQGKSADAIATFLEAALNYPWAWGENMARTVQAWSARRASHENYRRNNRIVEGWMWWAALDHRTCLSCISQHGTIYGHDRILNDHHRGRCTPVPVVRGSNWWRDVQSGRDWYATQPEDIQRDIAGPGKYDLIRQGRVNWDDLSVAYDDPVYGLMLRVATVQELVVF